jgi:hypothetical protein
MYLCWAPNAGRSSSKRNWKGGTEAVLVAYSNIAFTAAVLSMVVFLKVYEYGTKKIKRFQHRIN